MGAAGSRGFVARQSTPRKLAVIMMADVVGFSRVMERNESATFARLQHLRDVVTQPKIDAYGGRLVKTTGDGFLVEFASATAALQCALDIQGDLTSREAECSTDERIRLRIGINVGDIIVDVDDVAGDGVNIAARLEALASPEGICISGTVRDQIHDDLGARRRRIRRGGARSDSLSALVVRGAGAAHARGLGRLRRSVGRLIDEGGSAASFQIAAAHAWRGEVDDAFAWLVRAYRERDPGLGESVACPLLRSLYDDPRSLALMRKMGFA